MFTPTCVGVAYACFIVDAFSQMIVDGRVAAHNHTSMVLDALEMVRCHAPGLMETIKPGGAV